MASQKKKDQVKKLNEKLEKAKAFYLTDYKGMTHKQLEELRKALKKIQAEYMIVKNTLFKIALEKKDKKAVEKFDEALTEPTAVLFAYDDQMKAVKTLNKYIKEFDLPKVKLGIFEEELSDADSFKNLASLPSKEILLSTLLMRLQAPIYNLHYALSWNMKGLVTVLDNVRQGKK